VIYKNILARFIIPGRLQKLNNFSTKNARLISNALPAKSVEYHITHIYIQGYKDVFSESSDASYRKHFPYIRIRLFNTRTNFRGKK
jgi:hypothetical protein